jgi:2-polyprenyl-3-methyl-5-hydroxy-6-metoxy-1,4-benzoquinol methylase
MPSSSLIVAPRVIHYVYEVSVRPRPRGRRLSVLDVGPGHGKYATLLREYVDPKIHLVAVEAWAPYVPSFKLEALYDLVIVGDVVAQPDELLNGFDLVLMVDVLEHIDKTPALELLARIEPPVVFSTPRDYFQNPPHLPHTERHISHWSKADFEATGRLEAYDDELEANVGGLIGRLGRR